MRTHRLAVLALALAVSAACGSSERSPYDGLGPQSLRLEPPPGSSLVPGEKVTLAGRGFIDDPGRILVRIGTEYVHPEESASGRLVLTVPRGLERFAGQHVPVQVFVSNFRSPTVQLPVVLNPAERP